MAARYLVLDLNGGRIRSRRQANLVEVLALVHDQRCQALSQDQEAIESIH